MVFCNLGRPALRQRALPTRLANAPRQRASPTRLADAPRHRNALVRGLGNDFFK